MTEERYEFYEDRQTYVREQLQKKVDGGNWENEDISASNLSVRLRAFVSDEATLVLNQEMSKVVGDADAGDTGIVEAYVSMDDAYTRLEFRMVLIDNNSADADSVSGYREIVRLKWFSQVHGSPAS